MELTDTTKLMSEVCWDGLQLRRDIACLNIMYKLKLTRDLVPSYLCQRTNVAAISQYNTRGSIPAKYNIKVPSCRLASTQNSFFQKLLKHGTHFLIL